MRRSPTSERKCSVPSSTTASAHKKLQGDGASSCLRHALGLAFLTFTLIVWMEIHRSKDEPLYVALALTTYLTLLISCFTLRRAELALETALGRGKMKVALWLLLVHPMGLYPYRLAGIMPLPMAIVVWAMAGFTVFVTFYAAVIHRETSDGGGSGKTTSPL